MHSIVAALVIRRLIASPSSPRLILRPPNHQISSISTADKITSIHYYADMQEHTCRNGRTNSLQTINVPSASSDSSTRPGLKLI